MSSASTAARLLFSPYSYPRLWRLVRERLTGRRDSEPALAAAWCARHAVPVETAFAALFPGAPFPDLAREQPAALAAAAEAARACPLPFGGAGEIRLLYALVRALPAASVVETGVAAGWTSLAVLLALDANGAGRLHSTDLPYREHAGSDFVGHVVPAALRAHWSLARGADRDQLPAQLAAAAPVDLCHYDSDKSYEGRAWAYAQLWPALRVGGILMSDDVGDNLAFQHFCRRAGARPLLVARPARDGLAYAGVIQKQDTRPLRPWQF